MVEAHDFCADEESKESAARLKSILNKYGSDKAVRRDYHYVYAFILKPTETVTRVLEIGLGTNNMDVVSHMGRRGIPGASLRAFRDFLPNAQIYGADIDRRILFSEERIETFFVDQTSLGSFDALGQGVGTDFDLIIDDGLHSPNANIAVLTFALSRLKLGGWLVVEDIAHEALPVWQIITALLPVEYKPRLINAKGSTAFAIQRTGSCPDQSSF
jgi:SAM-dependent methyltransferase